MLGRNTEMNLLQMNRQKNESACGIPFIFLVYLTEGGSESVAFSVIPCKTIDKSRLLARSFSRGRALLHPILLKRKKVLTNSSCCGNIIGR